MAKEMLGRYSLTLHDEGDDSVLTTGTLSEITCFLRENHDKYFSWINLSPWSDDGLPESELPDLSNIEVVRDLEWELNKVNLSWWYMSIDKLSVHLFASQDESEVYTRRENPKPGDSAVLVEYNYTTGDEVGCHNFLDTPVLAQLGEIGEDGDFIPNHYTCITAPNRATVGQPVIYEGFEEYDLNKILAFCDKVL